MEHRKKRGMLGSIGDLFDGPTGIGDALGLGLAKPYNDVIELVAAGAAGAGAIKAINYVEGMYSKIPMVGKSDKGVSLIAKYPAIVPAARIVLGAAAAYGLSMVKFPGSKAIAAGVGTTLAASGTLDLIAVLRSKPSSGADLQGVDGSPIYIRENGETSQLNGLPLRSRDVPASEMALGDMSYLQ